MPHPAPTTPAEAKYTDTDLEPIRDALAALANGDFRARGRTRGDSVMLGDIGSLLDEVTGQLSSLTSEVEQKAEQVADLGQGEAEPPGPADERQPPPVGLGILTETGVLALRQRQQPAALVEAHGLDADPLGGGELPDRQPSHDPKLAAVPRYGVKRTIREAPPAALATSEAPRSRRRTGTRSVRAGAADGSGAAWRVMPARSGGPRAG